MKILFWLIILWSCNGTDTPTQERQSPSRGERTPPSLIEAGGHLHLALFSEDLNNDLRLGKIAKNRSYVLTLELQNLGNLKAVLKEVKSETQSFEIQYQDQCLLSLKSGETCKFQIFLKAKELGDTNGFISFVFTSIDGQEQSVGLSFEALVVSNNRVLAPLKLRYTKLSEVSFGAIELDSSKRVLVEIENNEEVTRTLEKVYLREPPDKSIRFSGGEYPGDKGTCGRIFKQGNCLIELEFVPRNKYRYISELELLFEDQSVVLKISGNGKKKSSGKCFVKEESFLYPEQFLDRNQFPFPFKLVNKEGQELISLIFGTGSNEYSTVNKLEYNRNAQAYYQFPSINSSLLEYLEDIEIDMSFSQYYNGDNLKVKGNRALFCLSSFEDKRCSGVFPQGNLWKNMKNEAFWENIPEANTLFYQMIKNHPPKNFYNGFVYKKIDKRLNLKQLFGLQVDAFRKIFDHSNIGLFLMNNLKWENSPRLVLTFNREVLCVSQ